MKISAKEKTLLIILASAILVFCAFFFGYRNISKQNDDLDSQIKKLNSKYNSLQIMKLNAKEYQEDTIEYNKRSEDILNKFDTGFSQEYSIMFLKGIENKTGAWLNQAGLAQTEAIYNFGQTTSSNPATPGSSVYTTDYQGYKTTMNLAYEVSYKGLKDMINYINTYKYKCTIDSLSMSYNADSDTVSGSLVLTQYAITGSDREFKNIVTEIPLSGTGNIFSSSIFEPGANIDVANGDNIISDYDVYLSLQSSTADVNALSMGMKDDITGESLIECNDNKSQVVGIKIVGEAGNYRVWYTVDDKKYPVENFAKGAAFNPGDLLSFLIISSPRTGENDLSGVNITIANFSDMTLSVKIINEDSENPRVVVDSVLGDVLIFD